MGAYQFGNRMPPYPMTAGLGGMTPGMIPYSNGQAEYTGNVGQMADGGFVFPNMSGSVPQAGGGLNDAGGYTGLSAPPPGNYAGAGGPSFSTTPPESMRPVLGTTPQQGSPYSLGVPPSAPMTANGAYQPAYAHGGLVDAAARLRDAGRYGDSELVHVNPAERQVMQNMFGPETRNPHTGLPEHFSFGSLLQTLAPFANFIPGVGPLVSAGMAGIGTAMNASKSGKSSAASTSTATPTPGIGGLGFNDLLKPRKLTREKNAPTFDPFTYGQKSGEFNFFKPMVEAPAAPVPPVAEPMPAPMPDEYAPGYASGGAADDDMMAHLVAYHRDGGHQGPGQVRGIGTGQDDKIPAWLSDGEYVWSAQDVADLGDGSTDAGVRKLDEMRQLVRKQAGRKDVKKIAKPQRGIDHMLKAVGGSV
jgi:hypothetical protein